MVQTFFFNVTCMCVLFTDYAENLHKPAYKVVLFHALENLFAKDLSRNILFKSISNLMKKKTVFSPRPLKLTNALSYFVLSILLELFSNKILIYIHVYIDLFYMPFVFKRSIYMLGNN